MKHWNDCELPGNGLFPEQYTIQEIIRDSAASTLLLGHDKVLNVDVVIKCFKPSAKGAYLREISAAFDIQHPNLVRCLNTFHRNDGVACIVYEYLAGGNLSSLLESQKPLSVQTIVACLQAMLHALIYLNSVNRIHCDIKPENILLRPKADGQVDYVLIDLGAACVLREAQEGQHVTGTPAYIAPERIKNRFFFNSDLYSLGVIAFEMSTGKRPFTGTVEELTKANLSDMPSLTDIQPVVLRDFIDHLLVKNPKQRIDNATLALTLLNKISTETMWLGTNLSNSTEIDDWECLLSIDKEQPLNLHCFHAQDRPLVALVYSYHIDIIDPLKSKQPIKTLLTSYPLQVLDADKLAYATPSRIQIVDLTDATERLVKEQLQNLKTWHVAHDKLLWCNPYYCFYDDLSDNAVIKFNLPNYLFESEMNILPDGSFATSEGIANNKIVLRNNHAKASQEWLLDEAVIALSHHDASLLAITINWQKPSAYTLWLLTENQAPQRLALTDDISQILCINGAAFWLADKTILRTCNTEFRLQTLNTLPRSAFKFAVSYDHRFLLLGHKNDDNRLLLTIIKIRAAS